LFFDFEKVIIQWFTFFEREEVQFIKKREEKPLKYNSKFFGKVKVACHDDFN